MKYLQLLLCILTYVAASTTCRTPTGIDASNYLDYPQIQALFNEPQANIFGFFASFGIPALGTYETPIQFRLIQYLNLGIYNSMASYEPTALDHFARQAESADRRFCAAGTGDEDARETHRRASLAYALYYGSRNFLPEIVDDLGAAYGSLGLDMAICDDVPSSNPCDDTATPWGFGKLIADEIAVFAADDGWNADGSLNRDVNRIPYSDWREDPYEPRNSPWRLQKKTDWQPLVEHDGLGFISWQQHVTPHIGQTGRSMFLGDAEICQLEAPRPHYDLEEAAEGVFTRMQELTSDAVKMEVESFDSKLTSIVPLTGIFMGILGATDPVNPRVISADTWEFILVDSAIIASLYESTLVVWKEKVYHDGVRPPSYVQARMNDDDVTTYVRGPPGVQGAVQTHMGNDFEPYIRTMPHAEYPSASACVCGAFEYVMLEFFDGEGDFADLIPAVGSVSLPPFPMGSSRVEPGVTPAADVTLTYSSFTDISQRCGDSRLQGGMHFDKSVPAGHDLCADIGTTMAQMIKDLDAGNVPANNIVNFNNPPGPQEERC